MFSPVRGSPTDGGCGASSAGDRPLNTLILSHIDFFCVICVRRLAKRLENTIGASDVVSEPIAMPHSI